MTTPDLHAEEEQCCGSGCNSCVLDKKQIKTVSDDCNKTNVLSNGYVNFKVLSLRRLTTNVILLKFGFNPASGNSDDYRLFIPPGYHLMLRALKSFVAPSSSEHKKHDDNTADIYISRPYTPIMVDICECTFHILFKLEEHGAMSSHIKSLEVNDLTEWKGPYMDSTTSAALKNNHQNVICIGQGVGIAPLYSLIENILNDEFNETRVHFITCFKNIENILLRDEIHSWKQFWNFEHSIYLSREALCECRDNIKSVNCTCIKRYLKYNENIHCFRLKNEHLLEIYKNLNTQSVLILICGSNEFCINLIESLNQLDCNIDVNNVICFGN